MRFRLDGRRRLPRIKQVGEPRRGGAGPVGVLASAELGERTSVPGDLDTLMAGLACGEPSLPAWQELKRSRTARDEIGVIAIVEGQLDFDRAIIPEFS